MMNSIPSEPTSTHLTELRIAALADGEFTREDEELHLTLCRKCSALYAELVQIRALDFAPNADVPTEVLDAGHRFVDERFARSPRVASQKRRVAIRWSAALAAVAALALVLTPLFQPHGESLRSLPTSLRAELISDSSHGLVHPMVASASSFDSPALRGGSQRGVSQALDELQQQLEADPMSIEAAATLVSAFQALDQIRNARIYLNAALERHPASPLLQGLAVEQYYREGRSDEAIRLLRDRLGEEPEDDLTRLNLAILLHKSPDESDRIEAVELATEVASHRPGTALATRAGRVLG